MDYEQWKPLGRGDPLKNDPTYDYVPPVLERVHYWIDPALRKPDPHLPGENQKTEILVLGVSSKKPSSGTSIALDRRDTYDPFLKFVEGPKLSGQQRIARPHYTIPSSYYPSPFYSNKNKLSERPGFAGKGEQRVPYTMLVPPPVYKRPDAMQFQKPIDMTSITSTAATPAFQTTNSPPSDRETTPEVMIQESNLVYHSSSSLSKHEWNDNQHATAAEPSSQVTWKTPTPNSSNMTHMHKTHMESSKIVRIHKQEPSGTVYESSDTKISSNFVTLPPIPNNSQMMHKGHVADDTMDIASSYVNIGKPEAQLHSPTGIDISSLQMPSPSMMSRQPPIVMNMHHRPSMPGRIMQHNMPPLTLQSIQTMQTMQPPPVSMPVNSVIPISTIHSLLQKEVTQPSPYVTNDVQDYAASELKLTPTTVPVTTSPATTTTTTLTTDPLFKHYKQPSEPIKGPMYLIIQGHSKVKTYGPSKQVHGISVQETNEIPTSDEYSVKHLHSYKKEVSDEKQQREGRSGNLQTLTHVVQTGLGAIDFPDIATNRRKGEDVQETELVVKYDVSSSKDATTEVYHKGIVEAGEIARKLSDLDAVTEH